MNYESKWRGMTKAEFLEDVRKRIDGQLTGRDVLSPMALMGLFSDHVKVQFKEDTYREQMWHAGAGIATEANEALDCIKAHLAYGKPLDMTNLQEEIGDLLFFLIALDHVLGETSPISLRSIVEHNFKKLMKRYPGGFSDYAAQLRLDKQETGETDNSPEMRKTAELKIPSLEELRAAREAEMLRLQEEEQSDHPAPTNDGYWNTGLGLQPPSEAHSRSIAEIRAAAGLQPLESMLAVDRNLELPSQPQPNSDNSKAE